MPGPINNFKGNSGGSANTISDLNSLLQNTEGGFSFTGGFAARDNPVTISGDDLNTWYRFDLSITKARETDQPWWAGASPPNDIDLFGGDHLPTSGTRVFDFENTDDADGHIGSIMCDQLTIGDTVTVRFDFYVTPSFQNTTVTYGIWFQTRNPDNSVDFAFEMPAAPIYLGPNSAGIRQLYRIETTFYIASALDQNALALPALHVDQTCEVEPISCLVLINR